MTPELQKLAEQGWRFTWSEDTRIVGAEHPRGGKMSILEIKRVDMFPLGAAIVAELNKLRPVQWNIDRLGSYYETTDLPGVKHYPYIEKARRA